MRSRSSWRRTSSLLAALLAQVSSAQDQRPLLTGPEPIVGGAVRVHVLASEELEPDVLRALAKPNVVLWLSTRSNVVRESSIDSLARFEASYVQIRPPLAATELRAFGRSPKTGWWVTLAPGEGLASLERARGARPLALEVAGALSEETTGAVKNLRPTLVRWTPPAELDLLQWSRFRSFPGRKVLVVSSQLLPRDCSARSATEPAAELHVATLLAVSAPVFPCGVGTRVEIAPDLEPWLLKSLVVRDPSVELVVRVDDSVRAVGKTRALLELLGR